MEFRILGPIEVENGSARLPLDAPKQRALLGVLLLHPNEVVSAERLIDELWGGRPPATAVKVVRTYVSQLRRLLGADAIATHAPGYLLRVDEDALDAARFHRLIGESRRLAASGDHQRAADTYREALALWRGPPLADVVFESFAQNEAERLDEERLSALMERIDCDLALGRHEELLAELETLVGQYPLRERLRAQLLLALYRSGRQAEALAVYQDARRTLVNELGLEPGRDLQNLEKAILTHDPALDAPQRTEPVIAPPAPRPVLRRLKPWHAAAAVAAIGLTLALLLAFALGGHEQASLQLAPNSVGFIDANSGRVTKSFPVGDEPSALIVSGDSVWVANYREQTVTRVKRETGDPKTITLGDHLHPTGIVANGDTIWVWTLERKLVPIDRYNRAGTPVSLARQIVGARTRGGGIAAGGGFLWLAAAPTTVIRVDRANPRTRAASIAPEDTVEGPITFHGGKAWVGGASQVFPISPGNLVVGTGAPIGPVRDLAFGAGGLWAVSGAAGYGQGFHQALWRLDPATGDIEQRIPVGSDPSAVAVTGGSVWVASRSERTVYRLDPATNSIADTIQLDGSPTALAVDTDGVWVTVR